MTNSPSLLNRSLQAVTATLFCLSCINVAVLSWIGSYEIRFGAVQIPAHGLFKPILAMNGCFILLLMALGRGIGEPPSAESFELGKRSLQDKVCWQVIVVVFTTTLYLASAQINLGHHDWTHRHISEGINSLRDAWMLFTNRQADGFYRPLAFLSLWIDYRLFGSWYPGYHIQSMGLHALNAILVSCLAYELRLGRACAIWAGALFSVAAVNFEPVLWPAARFDLLAAACSLSALIFAVRYFRSPETWTRELLFSQLFLVLGILNKESSYCIPILVVFIVCTGGCWFLPRPASRKCLAYFSVSAVITLCMVAVRIAIYGNLGGYSTASGMESAHFAFGLKTIVSILRVLPLSIFGVNTTGSAPGWLPVLVFVFAVLLLCMAPACRRCFGSREYMLAVCTLIASIPVINICGWIGSTMQHSRYLYLPEIFSVLMIVSILTQARHSRLFLALFLLLNAAGTEANLLSYKGALGRIKNISESVRLELLRKPMVRAICLVDVPEHGEGIYYFDSELAEAIKDRIPRAEVLRMKSGGSAEIPADALIYQWNKTSRSLVRRASLCR